MRVAAIFAIFLTLLLGVPRLVGTDSEQRVDRVFAAYDKADSPGCALGVIRDGNFIYRKGYGMGSLELGVPLSSQSVFYMGSVSKQFTAASIVLAAEQGFLSLDDNIRKYIPEPADYGQPITLRQMLHHTSGLPDMLALLYISGRNSEDVHPAAEVMDLIVRQKKLNFQPGEEYQYSNTNYFLLGEILKRATKKPLSEFAAQYIFKPLKMTHTRFYDDHNVVVPGRVAGYSPGEGSGFLVNWSLNYELVGGGGLMSSVDDMFLWDGNFFENKLGKGTLLKEMQTTEVLNGGRKNDYALGLFVSTYRGSPIVEHDGANFGYRTDILRFPEQKFSVVTLCNVASADPASLSRKVAEIYLEKELQRAADPVAISGADPAAFAGEYFDRRMHFPVSFTAEHGNLILQGHVLEPIGKNQFQDPIIGGTVTFSGPKDAVQVTVIYNHAVTFSGARIADLHVDEAALGVYAGTYRSAELDATYKLWVEKGNLMLRMNWNPAVKLRPIVRDEFAGGGITVVFRRAGNGNVPGLSVFAGWNGAIRDESFEKLN
jgi:CubicO group peptidase (beta-lactamase class C family)